MDEVRSDPLRIDIVSDVVCPWCVIGHRQLAQALDRTGTPAAIRWHPFELNPDLGPDGQDLGEHVAAKYGATPEDSRASRDRLSALGDGLGFRFAFGPGTRIRNTFRAHQLIHWARPQGLANVTKQGLFTAYFTNGLDVHDLDVLVGVAAEVGLDPAEARAVLIDARYADAVRAEEAHWTSLGIQGVPAMIFAGKYLVSGAQGVDTYASILRNLTSADVGAQGLLDAR